jgi:hypothetical protein
LQLCTSGISLLLPNSFIRFNLIPPKNPPRSSLENLDNNIK